MRDSEQVEVAPRDVRMEVLINDATGRQTLRAMHIPTGTTVTVDDYPNQMQDRARALTLVRELLGRAPHRVKIASGARLRTSLARRPGSCTFCQSGLRTQAAARGSTYA